MLIRHQAPVINDVKYNGNKVTSFKYKSTLFQSTTSHYVYLKTTYFALSLLLFWNIILHVELEYKN